MQASVKIMDVEVDMLSNDVFVQKMNEYLNNDRLNTIFFASTETLDLASGSQEYCQWIEEADLFLPGEKVLLSGHHADVLEAGGMVVNCYSLGLVLENLQKEDRTIFIIAGSDHECEVLSNWCLKMQPELQIVGTCSYDFEIEDMALINDINAHAPDMLLVNLPVGQQEEWIMKHSSLLNASLCIAIGGVANLIIAREKETPAIFKRFHLERLYEKVVREQQVKKNVRARSFHKKIEEYKNQSHSRE